MNQGAFGHGAPRLAWRRSRNTVIDDFIDAWQEDIGDLADPISLVFKQPTMGPGGRAIEIRAKHDDLAA